MRENSLELKDHKEPLSTQRDTENAENTERRRLRRTINCELQTNSKP